MKLRVILFFAGYKKTFKNFFMSNLNNLPLIDQAIYTKDGEVVSHESLSQLPVICYYVAAKWCPSSKKFKEELENFYNAVNQPKKRLEIIYISVDASETDHKEQVSSFPWLNTAFNTPGIRKFLSENSITLIPSLLLIKKEDGTIIKKDCRGDVHFKGAPVIEEWINLSYEAMKDKITLNESSISKQLNNSTSTKR